MKDQLYHHEIQVHAGKMFSTGYQQRPNHSLVLARWHVESNSLHRNARRAHRSIFLTLFTRSLEVTRQCISAHFFGHKKSLGITPTGLWRIPMMSCHDEKMLNIQSVKKTRWGSWNNAKMSLFCIFSCSSSSSKNDEKREKSVKENCVIGNCKVMWHSRPLLQNWIK